MRILCLKDEASRLPRCPAAFLRACGHDVSSPDLPERDFSAAVLDAQAAFDAWGPDVVVGQGRGGAVAMNLKSGSARLVLIAPAWKRFGRRDRVKPGTIILHSESDTVVPLADSRAMAVRSGLKFGRLVVVGRGHEMADAQARQALQWAVEGRADLLSLPQSDDLVKLPAMA